MKNRPNSFTSTALVLIACLGWWAGSPAQAQFAPQIGGGGGTRTGSTGAGARTYQNNTTVGEASVSINPDTRQLVIAADEETQTRIAQVIANLDQPKPQVLIKVVFLEVTYNKGSEFGLQGSYNRNIGGPGLNTAQFLTNYNVQNVVTTTQTGGTTVSNSTPTILPSSITSLFPNNAATFTNTFPFSSTSGGIYSLLGSDYTLALKAIATAGKAQILSRPSILARSSQPATITVGQSVPLVSGSTVGALGTTVNTVTYTSVGIILKVTPFVSTNGYVEMIVSPESSQLADRSQWVQTTTTSAGQAIFSPVINTTSADTVVVVPDGQTVIIGGLMDRQKSDSEDKIPFLGSIPLLGNLFKHQTHSDQRTELMIFLTPHIVPAPGQLAALTALERQRQPAPTEGLSDRELDQFLEGLPKDGNSKEKGKGKKDKTAAPVAPATAPVPPAIPDASDPGVSPSLPGKRP